MFSRTAATHSIFTRNLTRARTQVHMCRYRRSQLLYVVPRPAYHQICDVIVDYRDSDGKHQLLRDDGNKASARWLDLREISFTIESLAVTPYNLPKPGDHVIVYDRIDDTVDALNAVVVGLEKCKDTWTVDVEYVHALRICASHAYEHHHRIQVRKRGDAWCCGEGCGTRTSSILELENSKRDRSILKQHCVQNCSLDANFRTNKS